MDVLFSFFKFTPYRLFKLCVFAAGIVACCNAGSLTHFLMPSASAAAATPAQTPGQPQPGYPQPQPGYLGTQTGYPQPQAPYMQPQPGYPRTQPGYPQTQPTYPGTQAGYPQSGYPQPQSGYPQPQPTYPGTQAGYPQPGYQQTQPGYPQTQPTYPGTQAGYPQPQPQPAATSSQEQGQAAQSTDTAAEPIQPFNTDVLNLSAEHFDFGRDWWKYALMLLVVSVACYVLTKAGKAILRFLILVFCFGFSGFAAYLFGPLAMPLVARHCTFLPADKCPPLAVAYFIVFIFAYIVATVIVKIIRRPVVTPAIPKSSKEDR